MATQSPSTPTAIPAAPQPPKEYVIVESLSGIEDRELGVEAVFSISSAKPGNGVDQLRDNILETYWQSDGSFPHLINIQFLRKVSLTKLCLYLDYATDESYTPKKVSVSIGTCLHDLSDIITVDMNEPCGWVVVDLTKSLKLQEDDTNCIRAHLLQVKVLAMHQNGKDTHIRQLKIYGKREPPRVMADLYHDDFKTVEMAQYCMIR